MVRRRLTAISTDQNQMLCLKLKFQYILKLLECGRRSRGALRPRRGVFRGWRASWRSVPGSTSRRGGAASRSSGRRARARGSRGARSRRGAAAADSARRRQHRDGGRGAAGAALAAEMAAATRASRARRGADVARRCYIREEQRLLTRVAAGSPRAFHSLDALRKGPCTSRRPSPRASSTTARARRPAAMQRDGDFALGVSRQGDAISDHPAARGALPVVGSARDVPRPSARPTTSGEGATARAADDRLRTTARPTTSGWREMPTARPLPEGWLKVESRSRPGLGYYYDGATSTSQWKRPCTAPVPR